MSRQLLRWAALPVTDRRWAAPLAAVALGFGLFAGVAIGPGAAGTFATGAAQIIEIPGFSGGADAGGEGEGEGPSPVAANPPSVHSGGGGGSTPASGSALPPLAPAGSPAPPQSHENLALADAVPVIQPDALTGSQCADLATIIWQIYADDPSALPFPDTAALQEWICAATPSPVQQSR